ncbi:hypothetical protein KL86DPRO_10485 [uncultured delta proteobacterium]|uniref:HicB-like antitoxin of toxin-antitoxin system domain-containing protein n=1 Tax=uncultured delta proteobacterium TaxID=34034 RepID=A0A212J158_9DELT|nr:hypothetical protein KL86DPRO_10485 [uncultured delta proteobacterium]
MGDTKEKQPGSIYYALFIPSQGKYFIIFPDFCHALPRVSTLEECPHAARELLNNILLRHLIDREPLPVPSCRRVAEANTLDYIRRVSYPLDGDAPICAIPYDRKTFDHMAARVTAFRASASGGNNATTRR